MSPLGAGDPFPSLVPDAPSPSVEVVRLAVSAPSHPSAIALRDASATMVKCIRCMIPVLGKGVSVTARDRLAVACSGREAGAPAMNHCKRTSQVCLGKSSIFHIIVLIERFNRSIYAMMWPNKEPS